VLFSVLPMALRAEQKAPVPDAQAEQTARTSAGELFGSRFRQAKTNAEKTAVAAEMIEAAGKLQDGTPGQYVLLKIAADVAAGAGDAPTALQLEVWYQGEWVPVVRYDNAHGFCHRDALHPDGSQDKTGVFVGDVNQTCMPLKNCGPTGKPTVPATWERPSHDRSS
jgi:hypothetical protein